MLAAMLAFYFSALTGAFLIGWIFSVCVHEFAHALAAYWGGDRSAQTRAYLKFNPIDYLDPVMSLLIPSILLLMGGVPFPGGAVRIDKRLLRSRHWWSLVSAAGPLSNILLFVILAAVVHPAVGIIEQDLDYANWERFLGGLTVLQLVAVFINLIPLPPLDGFGIIEPYLREEDRWKFRQPAYAYTGLIVVFVVLGWVKPVAKVFWGAMIDLTMALGLDWDLLWGSYNLAFFGTL